MLGRDSGTEAQTTSPVRFRLPNHHHPPPFGPGHARDLAQSASHFSAAIFDFVAVLGSWPLGEKSVPRWGCAGVWAGRAGRWGKCVRSGSVAVWAATMHYDLCSRPPMTTTTCSTHTRTHARSPAYRRPLTVTWSKGRRPPGPCGIDWPLPHPAAGSRTERGPRGIGAPCLSPPVVVVLSSRVLCTSGTHLYS